MVRALAGRFLSACERAMLRVMKVALLLGIVGSVAALTASVPAPASLALYPNAAVCARAWNQFASRSEKSAVAASRARDARVFATSNTGVPSCALYFLAPKSTLYATAKLGTSTPRWTKPRVCQSQPAGILMQVSRSGTISPLG